MATYNGPPPTNTFKPIDWDQMTIKIPDGDGQTFGGAITSSTMHYNLPGELLDYTMKYDLDWIRASGWTEQDLHDHLKKELAAKLAQQMMDNGHIEFTKQTDLADNSVRFKAYTWVGNKAFIEQQRKNKR